MLVKFEISKSNQANLLGDTIPVYIDARDAVAYKTLLRKTWPSTHIKNKLLRGG